MAEGGAVKSTANLLKKQVQHCLNILYNGDTFYDVIIKDECSVKIERYTRQSSLRFGFVLFCLVSLHAGAF